MNIWQFLFLIRILLLLQSETTWNPCELFGATVLLDPAYSLRVVLCMRNIQKTSKLIKS